MKTKLSKRILSVLLAALMVVTSIPLMAFTAFADETDSLVSAMNAYEGKMNGTVYTNMSAAYNAYVDAQKALDAYKYGDAKNVDLNAKAQALTAATNAMTQWSEYTGTAIGSFANDDNRVSAEDYASVYKNLLYVGTGLNNVAYSATAQRAGKDDYTADFKMYYGDTTLLYDGKTDPQFAVMLSMNGNKKPWNYNWNNLRIHYAYVSSNDGLQFIDNWHGTDTQLNFQWTWLDQSATNCGLEANTSNSANGMNGKYLANVMRFTGTDSFNEVMKSVNPEIAYNIGYDKGNDSYTATPSPTIRILNYKLVVDTMNANTSKLANVANYKEGGLATVIDGYQKATADPNSFFTSGNDYTACQNNYQTAVNNMNSDVTAKADSNSEYTGLRNAMDASGVRATFNGGNTGYTEDSWSAFETAYKNAQSLMANVPADGYTKGADAKTYADALTAAYAALETNSKKVDTSALEKEIDDIYALDNIFTDDSYNALVEKINEAIIAVWGSVDNYKVATAAPEDSEESQALVAQQAAKVQEAVKTLRIDMDALVEVENSANSYSVNKAISLSEGLDPNNYSNYTTVFLPALNAAKAYAENSANVEFTDYNTQLAEYKTVIENLIKAYSELEYSFIKIPNGTAFKNTGVTTMNELSKTDQGKINLGFSYTNSAIVFKTTHEETTAKYGTASVRFGVNITNDYQNNMLDSISINATADPITANAASWIDGYNTWSSKPKALSDGQKATYAGCLSYTDGSNGTISLANLRYADRTSNCATEQFFTLQDGTKITDEAVAKSTDLTAVLGTTDGASAAPAPGGVFAYSSNGEFAYTTIDGDLTVTIPASGTKITDLDKFTTATTVSAPKSIKLTGYFGGVVLRNVQNTSSVAGYSWYTTQENSESINSTVQVIDISYLVDLVEAANKLTSKSNDFTETSWAAFAKALSDAQASLDYNSSIMNASTISNNCKSRYTNLLNAYKNLKVPVTFNYKNDDGTDASKTIEVKYKDRLSNYNSQIKNIISAPTYTDGDYIYTLIGWDSNYNTTTPIEGKTVINAEYSSKLNKVDFTEYNAAVAQLLGKLTDETYSVADLVALNDALSKLTYLEMSDADRDALLSDDQGKVDAETAEIVALTNGLTPCDLTLDAAVAAAEELKAAQSFDEDIYDISSLELNYTDVVSVIGTDGVVGLAFDSQDTLDAAIKAVLNELHKNVYTVYLNGEAVGTAEYGTPVIVSSDGKLITTTASNLDSMENDGPDMVAWTYSYNAPSRENQTPTAPKYMLTAKSLGFIVKGDTWLTTAKTNSDGDDNAYVVKFIADIGNGKVFDIQYVTNGGKVTIPEAPKYAFYNFTGYDNGYTAGQEITVTADTTIYAKYTAQTADTFTINYYEDVDPTWYSGEPTTSEVYNYNELVTLSNPNAYCWTSAWFDGDESDEYTILAYGTEYSFYACQDLDIVPLTEQEFKDFTTPDSGYEFETILDNDGNKLMGYWDDVNYYPAQYFDAEAPAIVSVLDKAVPVYTDNKLEKFSMIGSFACPEGYSIVEAGILFSTDQAADLTVENAGSDGIFRMKASAYTVGNQFAINVKAPADGSDVSFKYKAYAVFKNADGKIVTSYSTDSFGDTANF